MLRTSSSAEVTSALVAGRVEGAVGDGAAAVGVPVLRSYRVDEAELPGTVRAVAPLRHLDGSQTLHALAQVAAGQLISRLGDCEGEQAEEVAAAHGHHPGPRLPVEP